MKLKIFLVPILILSFISCDSDDGKGSDLTKNRELWESHKANSYTMNQRTSCFCGGILEWDLSVINHIKDDVVFDETLLSPGQTHQDILNNAKTVEELFNYVESLENQELASLIVAYDDVFGFPRLISIDFSEAVVDDEVVYIYADFVKVN